MLRLLPCLALGLLLTSSVAAQDTSILACPSFFKNSAGALVRVGSCRFVVKAPASPNVDKICFKRTDTNAELKCAEVKPSEQISVTMTPAAPGSGHVIFAAFAVDSDSPVGTLESAASDRRGVLIDLDVPTMIQAIIEPLPSVDAGPEASVDSKSLRIVVLD